MDIINEKIETSTDWLVEKVGKHLIVMDNLSSNNIDINDICIAEQFGASAKYNMSYDECAEDILLKLRGQIASSRMQKKKELNEAKNLSLWDRLFNAEAKEKQEMLSKEVLFLESKAVSKDDVRFLPLPNKVWLKGLISEGSDIFLLSTTENIPFAFKGKCYISTAYHTDKNDISEVSVEYKIETNADTYYFVHNSNDNQFQTNDPDVLVFFDKDDLVTKMNQLVDDRILKFKTDCNLAINSATNL